MIRPKPGTAVATILLPPLGVFLDRGMGRHFWIATGLTCLAFLPGMAFALYSVLSPQPQPA